MNRLIIIAGASGAGKSFLLEQLYERFEEIEPVKKLSTRQKREYEKLQKSFVDLIFDVKLELINQCEYHYKYAQYSYGIQKDDLDYILDRGGSPIIIVRTSDIVKKLKQDYPHALTIYVQNILSGDDLKNRLKLLGRSDIKQDERMARFERDFNDYCSHANLYDYVLLNKLDKHSFLSQFENIIDKESKKHTTSRTITFISGNEYAEKFKWIKNLHTNSDYLHYNLIKLNEFKSGPILSQSVDLRLLKTDFVILDMEGDTNILSYYQGYLKAHNIDFICLYPENSPVRNYNTIDINIYKDKEEFLTVIEEKFHQFLRLPKLRHIKQVPIISHLMGETIKEAEKTTFEDDKPRPYVGAILVDSNFNIIAKAHRGGEEGNGQHAEFRLLDAIKHIKDIDLKRCTLFVSLEPCTTRNHPKIPCCERVIISGIGTIYVGMLDPDIRIRGIGVTKLKEAGVKVEMFPTEIENKLRILNHKWIQNIKETDYC
jgi:pyrimidine deaminase RibD-like protein/guanylate kinase